MEWWKEFGFEENPFDIKPNPDVLGLENEEKKIIFALTSGIPIHIYGEVGTGKTSMAKKIEKILGKDYIVIYLSGEEDENPDIEEIIRKRKRKFFFFEDKRKVILLLDECQRFSESFMRKVKYLFDERVIYSFATIQIERSLRNVSPSMLDRFNFEAVELKPPSEDVVKEIIKKRLRGKIKIDERGLDLIIKRNKRNVRGVLKTLTYIFSRIGAKKEVTYEDIVKNLPPALGPRGELKLSEQQRIIAQKLLEGPKSIKELEEELGIRKETLAKQLSRMMEKGYVLKIKEGNKVTYMLREDVKRELIRE